MGTISRGEGKGVRFFSSIWVKYLITYFSLVIALLAVLNTYPMIVSRELIFESKRGNMQSQLGHMASVLEALDELTEENVNQALSLIDLGSLSCVCVSDSDGEYVYYSDETEKQQGVERLNWGTANALAGYDAFFSKFVSGVFYTSAAMPIVHNGGVIGCVYVFEMDQQQGSMIVSLRNNIQRISVLVSVFALLVSLIFTTTLSSRLRKVLDAIASVREGQYNYRVDVSGHDELARLGEEFNSLTDRLQSTENIRRRFVSDASHELKTPLAAIRLLSDSILQTDEMDQDTVREFVTDIGNESERLARITEKLLSLARMDNKVIQTKAVVNVSKTAADALRLLRPLADAGAITLESQLEPDCLVFANADEIYQIILNLSENAVKYNVHGGSVHVSVRKESGDVYIVVSDTGIGIPESDLPNIFDRFYRVDKARSREAGGSGLGLSIVKSAVAENGGSVRADRREGGGMIFTVTFPAYQGKLAG